MSWNENIVTQNTRHRQRIEIVETIEGVHFDFDTKKNVRGQIVVQ